MSKKNNKKKEPYRSVLEESLSVGKNPDAHSDDADSDGCTDGTEFVKDDYYLIDTPLTDGGTDDGDDTDGTDDTDDTDDIDFDIFYDDDDFWDDDSPDKHTSLTLDNIIDCFSILLSGLLLIGSVVFWIIILRYLITSSYALADPVQMRTMLISCASIPAAIALVQYLLHRPANAEHWIISLCASSAVSAVTVLIINSLFRHMEIKGSDIALIVCSAVSGCTMPSFLFWRVRLLIRSFRRHVLFENSKDWETVRRDVLSLTDFKI